MTRIRILPLDIEIEAARGVTVMAAAQERGYYWPTTCGGEGRCTTCACQVEAGTQALSAMGRAEERTLVAERGAGVVGSTWRLACQATVEGEEQIVVRKPGVKPPL